MSYIAANHSASCLALAHLDAHHLAASCLARHSASRLVDSAASLVAQVHLAVHQLAASCLADLAASLHSNSH